MSADPIVQTPKNQTPVVVWLTVAPLEEVAYVEGAAMSRLAKDTGLSLSQMYQFYADKARERETGASRN